MKRSKSPTQADAKADATELIWLLGQPQLSDYLSFVANKTVEGESRDPRALVEEWRRANDRYRALEDREAGIADTIALRSPPKRLRRRIAAIEENRWFRRSFDNLPTEILRVELDKLVVSQLHVERSAAFREVAALGPDPDDADLLRLCLPIDRSPPPVRVTRLSETRYLLASPSTDFRAHTARLVRDGAAGWSDDEGPLAAVFGIGLGFGSNFLSGVRSGDRVLLQNGYHRAFALSSAGVTHAWCAVETVTRKDELRLTATSEVMDDPEFYFAAKRPPLLKDFFDPRIAKPLQVRAIETIVEVELTVREATATRID
jgi:hypothetical protein